MLLRCPPLDRDPFESVLQILRTTDAALALYPTELAGLLDRLSGLVRSGIDLFLVAPPHWNNLGTPPQLDERLAAAERMFWWQLGRIQRSTDIDPAGLADLIGRAADHVRERGPMLQTPHLWELTFRERSRKSIETEMANRSGETHEAGPDPLRLHRADLRPSRASQV